MSDAIHVCVADDRPISRNVMAHKLAKVRPNWTVHLCDTAETVLEEWEQMDLLIIDNDFGAGKLTGSQAIQLIRQQEQGEDTFIALWSAEHVQDDPGSTTAFGRRMLYRRPWPMTLTSCMSKSSLCAQTAWRQIGKRYAS